MASSLTKILVFGLSHATRTVGIFRNVSKSLPYAASCVYKSDSSSSAEPKKILSLSHVLLQDGLNIHEQPVIIRWIDSSTLPVLSDDADMSRPATAEEELFKTRLQQCSSIDEVFQLLEVPGYVTGYSASFALQRMCQLKEMSTAWDNLESFVCKAVMNELYSTVTKEISTMSSDMLISLVKCLVKSPDFCEQCAKAIKQDVERRIGDTVFTITELCQLSSVLHGRPEHSQLLKMIWVHIGNRYDDTDESNIVQVLHCLPKSFRHIASLLDKQSKKYIWKLSGQDVVSILNSYVRLNYFSGQTLKKYGRWVYLNLNDLDDTTLMQIVSAYIHFNFVDKSLLQALEYYVNVRGTKLDTNLLGIIIEYCCGRRYLLPRIMDAAALHFTDNCDNYNHLQIYTVLRPFGYLNYLPEKSSPFLFSVERTLMKEFDTLNALHLIEILCSFAFVRRLGMNFIEKLTGFSFMAKLGTLGNPERKQANVYLEYFMIAAQLETSRYFPSIFQHGEMGIARDSDDWHEYNHYRYILKRLLGQDAVQEKVIAKNSKYLIDFVVKVRDQCPVPVEDNTYDYGLAIMIHPKKHCCMNSPHLLGEFAMRNRHIAILMKKHQVVELTSHELETEFKQKRRKYVAAKLSPFIRFSV